MSNTPILDEVVTYIGIAIVMLIFFWLFFFFDTTAPSLLERLELSFEVAVILSLLFLILALLKIATFWTAKRLKSLFDRTKSLVDRTKSVNLTPQTRYKLVRSALVGPAPEESDVYRAWNEKPLPSQELANSPEAEWSWPATGYRLGLVTVRFGSPLPEAPSGEEVTVYASTLASGLRGFWKSYAAGGLSERISALETPPDRIDLPFAEGRTPLGLAMSLKEYSVACRLLELGADPDFIDLNGRAPIHIALARCSTTLLKLLVRAGADIEIRDAHGRTPLMYSLWYRSKDCAEILLDRGASLAAVDEEGRSIGYYAERMPRESNIWDKKALRRLRAQARKQRGPAFGQSLFEPPQYRRFLETTLRAQSKWKDEFTRAFSVVSFVGSLLFTVGVISAIPSRIIAELLGLPFPITLLFIVLVLVGLGYYYRKKRWSARNTLTQNRFGHRASSPTVNRILRMMPDALPQDTPGKFIYSQVRPPSFAQSGLATLANFVHFFLALLLCSAIFLAIGNNFGIAIFLLIIICVVCALLGWLSRIISLRDHRKAESALLMLQQSYNTRAQRYLRESERTTVPDQRYGLYLRCFYYDEKLVVDSDRQILEAALAYALRSSIDIVALGKPGVLGSSRLETAEEDWRDVFDKLAREASLIFVVPGDGLATLWEIEQLSKCGYLEKTVFIMPPELHQSKDTERAWTRILNHSAFDELELPPYHARGAVFALDNQGRMVRCGALAPDEFSWQFSHNEQRPTSSGREYGGEDIDNAGASQDSTDGNGSSEESGGDGYGGGNDGGGEG